MASCNDIVSIESLQNGEKDLKTISAVSNSKDPVTGAPIDQTTTRLGDTTDTLQGALKKLGVIYDDPIRDWTPSLLVSDLRAHRYPATTGDVYIPLAPLPFTTGATFDTTKWILARDFNQSVVDDRVRAVAPELTNVVFDTIADAVALPNSSGVVLTAGMRVKWQKYYSDREGGGNCGVVKTGAHTEDGGVIFSIDATTYIEATDYDSLLDPLCWGIKAGASNDDWQQWTNMIAWYVTKTIVLSPGSGGPIYSAPKIKQLRGLSQLSKPLVLPAYFHADFGQLMFARHSTWAESAGTYLLTSTDMYQADFGGMTAYDTDYVLKVQNNNIDGGKILVSGVEFANCNPAMRVKAQSSAVFIDNYKFDHCRRALIVDRCDMCVLERGWITQGALSDAREATIINNDALLVIKDMIGVPVPHSGSEVAWINNLLGRVDILGNARFGGEAGSCTLVNNFAPFTPSGAPSGTPTGVKIHDSQTYSVDTQGGTQKSCIVRLMALPNYVSFKDNRGMTLTDEAITWASGVDQALLVSNLLGQLRNYMYEYRSNHQDGLNSTYPDNLIPLFSPKDAVPLTATTDSSGATNTKTRIIPAASGHYSLQIRGQVEPAGSSQYETVWNGVIDVHSGNSGGIAVKRLQVTKISEALGGAAFNRGFTVSAVFWNGATENAQTPVSSTDLLRIKVSGWQVGGEGAGFKGVIRRLI